MATSGRSSSLQALSQETTRLGGSPELLEERLPVLCHVEVNENAKGCFSSLNGAFSVYLDNIVSDRYRVLVRSNDAGLGGIAR
jgi:hypothetical protein